jgi:lipocalin
MIASWIALFASFAAAAAAAGGPPVPVPELNRAGYIGHWAQVYSDLVVEATFENRSFCVTADYGVNPNGTVSVLNRERLGGVNGPVQEVYGWAAGAAAGEPAGQLTVHLQTAPFPAPYWILALGPNTTGQYAWSIVSDPFRATLFVLARNVSEFYETWNTDVLDFLEENGFTETWNVPIETVQDGC